ncbi:MAG: cellulase family glycosylhydrolase [Rhodopila sp.]
MTITAGTQAATFSAATASTTSAQFPTSTAQQPPTITPAQTLTDAAGNVWAITSTGSITENGRYTPGGGGTSALTIVDGKVLGEDANGRGWFVLSSDGQLWTRTSAPTGTAIQTQSAGTATSPSQETPTQTVTIPPSSCGSATSKQFGILPLTQSGKAQIIDASGNVFVPRGINVMYGNGSPSAATLKADFPGLNFVRLAIYSYDSPNSLAPYVNDLTSNGIVVELEDHNNNAGGAGGGQGVIFSGQTLTNESNWYASVASAFKSNPYVWFGTNNEPSTKDANGQTDPAALSQWQRATYDAIRGTGNQSIVFLETTCWTEGGKPVCNQGYDSSAYSDMSNVAWDSHVYGWLTNFNTDQATNDQFVSDNVSALSSIKSAGNTIMPVVIAEYGNSTTGQAIDPNGTQVVNAVNKSASNKGAAGASAWAWGSGNPGDGLTNGGSGLSSYGQQVVEGIQSTATPIGAPTACSSATSATTGTAGTTVAQSGSPVTMTAVTMPALGTTTPTSTTSQPGDSASTQSQMDALSAAQGSAAAIEQQAQQADMSQQITTIQQQSQSIAAQIQALEAAKANQ